MVNFFKMKWGVLALVVATFSFSSCDDDDKSIDEMRDEILANGSDALFEGLYGKVKTVTENEYSDTKWVNGKIVEGNLDYVTITNYDEAGFVTETESKRTYDAILYTSTKSVVVSRDNRNRVTASQSVSFSIEKDTLYVGKSVTTYDDSAKTAVVITSVSYDKGQTFEESQKIVYKLNRYGKIDDENYSVYNVVEDAGLKANIVTDSFETTPREQQVQEYDATGNPVLNYYKSIYGESVYIYSYTKTTYVYY